MLPKIKYIVVVAIFLFYSCNRQSYDFSSNEINISSGTKVDVGVLLGTPNELIYLDPLLLFHDLYDNTFVTVFDTKNEQFVRRFITRGQGPGEAVPPLSLFVSTIDKQIYAFQRQTKKLNIYELSDIIDIDKDDIMPKQFVLENADNIKKIKDGYVGTGYFEDGRFRLYDSIGNIVSSFGEYPFRGEKMNPMERYGVYQGYITSSADGNYFVIGALYCDNLEFYRIENGKAELIKKYETYDAKAGMNGSVMQVENDCIVNYMGAYGGKYCYMLYSGKPYMENNIRFSYGGNRIIVFDWDGNYIKSYKADVHIYSFCVDEENNIIYASVRDNNDETGGGISILKFDI